MYPAKSFVYILNELKKIIIFKIISNTQRAFIFIFLTSTEIKGDSKMK